MRIVGRIHTIALLGALCVAAAAPGATPIDARGSDKLFGPPAPPPSALDRDEVMLISSRRLGAYRQENKIAEGLVCERLVAPRGGSIGWLPLEWSAVREMTERPLPTVVFVHGNRVERGEDRAIGLTIYRALAPVAADAPFRLVIWSWPASQIPGPIKDLRLKAARADDAGRHLAWLVEQLPPESPVSLFGYSLGARVISGALHELASRGSSGADAPAQSTPSRRKVSAVLIAAAVNADWLLPRGVHGRSLTSVDRLVVVANRLDPAMRFYRFGPTGRGAQALGYAGLAGYGRRDVAAQVIEIDATNSVGRTHALTDYLSTTPGVHQVLRQTMLEFPDQSREPLPKRASANSPARVGR